MLQQYYGPDIPLHCVKPYNVLLINNTGNYVIEGKMEEDEKHVCTGINSKQGRHQHSNYTLEKNGKTHKGLRVKNTYAFTAVGSQAPPFISCSGITEQELPKLTCPMVFFMYLLMD